MGSFVSGMQAFRDMDERSDQKALGYWAGNAPDMQQEMSTPTGQTALGEPPTIQDEAALAGEKAKLNEAVPEAGQAGNQFGLTFSGYKNSPPPPDQPNRAVPVNLRAPGEYKPSTTAQWREYEQRMLQYSGAKNAAEIAAVREEVATYKQRRFNENWNRGLMLHQGGDVVGAAQAYQQAYDYVTNGQGVQMMPDPETGAVLAKPYHERTGIAGRPQAFTIQEAMEVPKALGPSTFGRDPAGIPQARFDLNKRAEEMQPHAIADRQATTRGRDAATASTTAATGRAQDQYYGTGGKQAVRTQGWEDVQTYRNDVQVGGLVEQASKAHNVSPSLVNAVIQAESAGNPKAKSHAGAQGLMQLMPATAKRFGVTDVWDPEQNINAGTQYLSWLLDRYDGDGAKALAGYNWGEGNVDKAVKKYGPEWVNHIPTETKNYLAAVKRGVGQAVPTVESASADYFAKTPGASEDYRTKVASTRKAELAIPEAELGAAEAQIDMQTLPGRKADEEALRSAQHPAAIKRAQTDEYKAIHEASQQDLEAEKFNASKGADLAATQQAADIVMENLQFTDDMRAEIQGKVKDLEMGTITEQEFAQEVESVVQKYGLLTDAPRAVAGIQEARNKIKIERIKKGQAGKAGKAGGGGPYAGMDVGEREEFYNIVAQGVRQANALAPVGGGSGESPGRQFVVQAIAQNPDYMREATSAAMNMIMDNDGMATGTDFVAALSAYADDRGILVASDGREAVQMTGKLGDPKATIFTIPPSALSLFHNTKAEVDALKQKSEQGRTATAQAQQSVNPYMP